MVKNFETDTLYQLAGFEASPASITVAVDTYVPRIHVDSLGERTDDSPAPNRAKTYGQRALRLLEEEQHRLFELSDSGPMH